VTFARSCRCQERIIRITSFIATTTCGLALLVGPSPAAGAETKAKAYGKQCQGQSKKHVAGQKGTPFSQCVTALAKVATGKANPTTACKTLGKKHVAGQKGTPYSRCVVAAAKLHNEQ
jgi:uncharacterized membrane protein